MPILQIFLLVAVHLEPNFGLDADEVEARFLASRKNVTETNIIKEKLARIFDISVSQQTTTAPVSLSGIISSPPKMNDFPKDSSTQTSTPCILTINAPIAEYLYQGDILLSAKQVDTLEKSILAQQNRMKRQIFIGENADTYKWSIGEPISYYFDASVEDSLKEKIRKGFQFWHDNSCLSFEESVQGTARVKVYRGEGCFSNVGKNDDLQEQEISIGYGCEIFGTITHEIAHTLAMEHLQNRPDRDDYVTVDDSKLSEVWQMAYAKMLPLTQESYNTPYEYGSVMHYGGDSPVTGTMQASDHTFQRTMGNRIKPTFMDILLINTHYNSLCNNTPTICANGGIKNSRNCSECICPTGFGGPTCESRGLPENDATCGATVQATNNDQFLNGIIGDDLVADYFDNNPACHWHIESPENTKIQIQLLTIVSGCSGTCWEGFVEIKTENLTITGSRYCCQQDLTTVVAFDATTQGYTNVLTTVLIPTPQLQNIVQINSSTTTAIPLEMEILPETNITTSAFSTNFPLNETKFGNITISTKVFGYTESGFSSTIAGYASSNNNNTPTSNTSLPGSTTSLMGTTTVISNTSSQAMSTSTIFNGLTQPMTCPVGWVYFSESRKCYKLLINITFDEANILCNINLNGNGQIASIHGMEENNFLAGWINTQIIGTSIQTSTFIGLELNSSSTTQYQWTDNSLVDYTNWCTLSPDICPTNNSAEQKSLLSQIHASQFNAVCLNLATNIVNIEPNAWMECQKIAENNAVCQTNAVVPTPPENCPMGWAYFEKTLKCYKIVNNVTADEALTQCKDATETGISTLASVHSDEENAFIAGLTSLQPIPGLCWVYLGLKFNFGSTSVWMDNSLLDYKKFCTISNHLFCQFNMPTRQYIALYMKGSCYVRTDGIRPLEWINIIGSERQSAVCQIDLINL